MKISSDLLDNDVPASGQLAENDCISFSIREPADVKVLFVGNSITRHGPAKELGWQGDWGMAASAQESDYVHLLVRKWERDGVRVSYGTANVSEWERSGNDAALFAKYASARDFAPDVLVMRLGENAKLVDNVPDFMMHYRIAIGYFAAAHTRVALTDLFWEYEPFDTAVQSLAERYGFAFVPLHDLGTREDMKATGKFAHAGVAAHPGDKGMETIAQRLYAALYEAVHE